MSISIYNALISDCKSLYSNAVGLQIQPNGVLSKNKRTILIPKELATQFNITTKTARTDLQDLVEMGYLLATNINKRAMGYIKSDRFDELIKATLNKKQGK